MSGKVLSTFAALMFLLYSYESGISILFHRRGNRLREVERLSLAQY